MLSIASSVAMESFQKKDWKTTSFVGYPAQRFQSDTERRFAVLLENDADVVKWFKPGKEAFQIFLKGDAQYEPDFVVETKTAKLICEIKATKDMETQDVQNKANAAVTWCEYASVHEKQ